MAHDKSVPEAHEFSDIEIKFVARESSRKAKKYISPSYSLLLQIQAMLLVSFTGTKQWRHI